MKSDVTSRKFPASSEEWEAIIAEAPGEDRPPTPAEEAAWSSGVVVKEGGYPAVRAALAEKHRWRGTQKAPVKVSTTLRLPPEVLAYFKATGPGWQTRIGEALKEWIKAHPPA
jgi:uncharacterized protein (DUF4415 family)